MKNKSSDANKKVGDQVIDRASKTYNWWNRLATLNKEDPIGLILFKLSIRILGIIIMVALSPIALVVLIIAFLTVL